MSCAMSNYISANVAHEVLWMYGHSGETTDGSSYGYEPSEFKIALYNVIVLADRGNRNRLSVAFPREVEACELAEQNGEGIAKLVDFAMSGYGDQR